MRSQPPAPSPVWFSRPLILVALLVLTGCLADRLYQGLLPRPIVHQDPPEGLAQVHAESCGACHTEIYEEWKASGMAGAYTDPVFQADWEHQDRLFYCLSCHAPLEAQQPQRVTGLARIAPVTPIAEENPLFDPALLNEGVTCVACHQDGGFLVGPHEVNAPHATRADPGFASADRCERCHQMPMIPLSRAHRPLTDTHAEWREWKQVTGREETCTDCHMSAVDRPIANGGPVRAGRTHTFPGAWSDEMVSSGLTISEARRQDDAIVLRLTNEAGHRFPSGEPGRALIISAVFRDAAGATLGDAEVRIERRVVLPVGRERGDTTLRPGETRTVSLPIPGSVVADTTDAVVQVVFDRLANLPATHLTDVPNRELKLMDSVVLCVNP